ncbi:hypothetical protein AYO40_02575 [Planctomycetaceae bacterium SCGC AG-212-D15]|nr:hypothetical protein AYO40_02575 [Planctomycetaceae bacterium SCGC AG-212-D15]
MWPVSEDPSQTADDEELALRLMDGDQEALRTLIARFGGKVRNILRRRYGDVLQEQEIDSVLNNALFKVWRHARSIDLKRGSLGGWFLRIAQRCAFDLLSGELAHREKVLSLDPESDPVADCDDDGDDEEDARTRKRLKDLDDVIDALPPLQKAIIKADMAAGSQADNGRLAARHGTSRNSIYVSRNKAYEAIRKGMRKRGHYTDSSGGKNE